MMSKNYPPSRRLSFEDAVQIWLQYWNGQHQHRIAAAYNVNPGRVNEVIKERKHVGSRIVAMARKLISRP